MFGPEIFVARLADRAMEPVFLAGDFVTVDLDEPAEPGRFVAVREGDTDATTVRRMVLEDGRRVLRAEDPDVPDVVLDASNETMIQGVVVFSGRAV